MAHIPEKDLRGNGRWTKLEHERFLLGNPEIIQVYNSMERIGKKFNSSQGQGQAPKFVPMLKNTF